MTNEQRDHFIALYEKSLKYVDDQVGRLIENIRKSGHADNTVIVIVADHGEEFLDHGRWGHWESNLHDEILRVPLIVSMPKGPQGKVVRQQVRLLDLMPTILDLCGCPVSDGVMGTSMASLLSDAESIYDGTETISEMRRDPWHRIAVRTESFKFIWDSKRPGQPDLYDLRADPGETQNVCDRFPAEVSRFQAIVDAHRARVAETEPAVAVVKPEVDEDVARRLRDLGYLD